LTDECFNGNLYHALVSRGPDIDVVRAQDVGLAAHDDVTLLAWAADHGRIVLSHDVNTLVEFAYDRTRVGMPMPGVVEVSRLMSIADAAAELILLAECSQEGEWEGQVLYLPM
jgi:hypothetical protein